MLALDALWLHMDLLLGGRNRAARSPHNAVPADPWIDAGEMTGRGFSASPRDCPMPERHEGNEGRGHRRHYGSTRNNESGGRAEV
jgi:hypothetical protein